MTARLIVFWVVLALAYWGLSIVVNGLFLGEWTLRKEHILVGVLLGFFAGAVLDLFFASLEEA